MDDLLYIISWTFIFGSASALVKLIGSKPGTFNPSAFWEKTENFKVVRVISFMLMILTVIVVVLGTLKIRWYAVLPECFAGMMLSALFLQRLNPLSVLRFSWIIVLASILWLWIKR